MAATNVVVRLEGNKKRVLLRDIDRETIPWKFTVVKDTEALIHAHPHERNCSFEEEAERYFNKLTKPIKPGLRAQPLGHQGQLDYG